MSRPIRSCLPLLALAALPAGPGLEAQQAPVRLEPLALIGCLDCEGPDQLGLPLHLAIDGEHVLLADRDEPHIRRFAAGGVPAIAFGRTGDGPGELRFPMVVGGLAEGIAVVDMRRRGIVLLGPGGDEVQAVPLREFPIAAAVGSDAVLLATTDFRTGAVAVRRWRPGPGGVETVVETRGLSGSDPGGGLVPNLSLAAAPDGGFAAGVGLEYRILRFDREGRPRETLSRDIAREPRTPEELEAMRERLSRGPGRQTGRGAPEAGADRPEPDPLRLHWSMGALAYDPHGRLWVRTDRGPPDATVFDLFGPSGAYLGEVRIPVRAQVFAVSGERLAAVVSDELGVPRLQVWRVSPR